ncbi:phosphopentomutase [uncultured Tateyamaria sp.]|uniref:phosphopentomutase n=1 Tax=uncultured Tateyamaria sp. TaxID=455651 RepID=UPI002603E168|nr:phosphopentomutase [uncultured Tateyamaria sp.]
MGRAFLVVMDSVGIGGAPDAHAYFNGDVPDTGANTLGHIIDACAAGHADEGRRGALRVPTLMDLGLSDAMALAAGETVAVPRAGAATETSQGKDTPSGHWELAGLPVPWAWHYFPDRTPAFPETVVQAVCEAAGVAGILGNCHASGTEIIARHGAAHMQSGQPICYTSADSVFQIAAHEETFGLERLLELCAAVAPMLHEMRVGRVIARPFVGTDGAFERTTNRRDFAIMPPAPILTNWVQDAGRAVYGVGKVGDIFSMQGFDEVRKGDDRVLMGHLSDLVDEAADGSLTFANFVEFDSLYGHRRDVAGYARHLEWFDAEIGRLRARLRPGDLLVLTADHGNDPTWVGTDHTRERVPVLVEGAAAPGLIGFADVAHLVARHLGVSAK